MCPSFRKMAYLSIAILAFCLNSAFADYHYVSPNGSDQYPYSSWGTAAHIIDSAIYAASAFDTIYIGAGEYNQIVYQRDQDTCLTFIGAGIDSTKLWTDQNLQQWFAVDKTVVDSIWFEHSFDQVSFGTRRFGANIMVQHCKFTNQTPELMGYAIMAWGEIAVVENCEFYDKSIILDALYPEVLVFRNNYMKGRNIDVILGDWLWGTINNNILIVTGGAHFFSEPTNYNDSTTFENNYIENMMTGFKAGAPLKCRLENNTARNSTYCSQFIYPSGVPGQVTFKNNAFTESQYGISVGNAGYESVYVAYNGFWNNSIRDIYMAHWDHVDTIGNINAFPMYTNPDSFDVHLQAYSPFIDAGDPDILDVDGTRSDIGCYGGPGGCSYVYLDLAPQIPDSISARRDSSSIILTWRRNYEADFNRYQIFRDTVSGFAPSVFNMIAEPETSFYMDNAINQNSPYYYKLTSVDNQHNVSDLSDEIAVNPTSIPPFEDSNGLVPRYTTITTAYPNPFNSNITIVYSASNLGPQPPEVSLKIFDVGGRVVRTLVNEHKPVGTYRITWDGKDDSGDSVSSGTYIARVSQWGMSGGDFPIKITLLK
jgi:hypothetical protein